MGPELIGPELQADVSIVELLVYAVFNPATIAVAFWMGRRADQAAKIMIAAFAGAVAGIALLYLVTLFRLWDAPSLARAGGGIFIASLVAGTVYAFAGFRLRN